MMKITAASEAISYIAVMVKQYQARYAVYHVFNTVQGFLFTSYFINVLKPARHQALVAVSAFAWPLVTVLNCVFLQSLTTLNYNILLLECFCFVTLSLTSIYQKIRTNVNDNIFGDIHFRLSLLFLFLWSSTLFFWATVQILYRNHWQYADVLQYAQMTVNIIMYMGIGATLFFHDQKRILENI